MKKNVYCNAMKGELLSHSLLKKKEGDGKLIKEKNILWQTDSSASVASASLKQKQVDSCFATVNIGAKQFMKPYLDKYKRVTGKPPCGVLGVC